ncbi:MAG TPA: hypothetical protein VFW29_01770 [Solirubrobacteraceae bacterium]|nr:hypothetical protein [Solirubrobacteraceae bacterium]
MGIGGFFILILVLIVLAVLGGGAYVIAAGLRRRKLHPEQDKVEGESPAADGRPEHHRVESEQRTHFAGTP